MPLFPFFRRRRGPADVAAPSVLHLAFANREAAQVASLAALRAADPRKAAAIVVGFESTTNRPRGVNMTWDATEEACLNEDIAALLRARPAILRDIGDHALPELRIAAAMMLAWGDNRASKWLPSGFSTGSRLDPDTAARMFVFHVAGARSLRQMRASGVVKGVEILTAPDSCPACRRLKRRKRYPLQSVPELPHPGCTHPLGCRCCYAAIT